MVIRAKTPLKYNKERKFVTFLYPIWCGCRALRKRLSIVFSERSEARAEDHPSPARGKEKDRPFGTVFFFILRVTYEKDTKLKADELRQKRMNFYSSGFNFNDGMIVPFIESKM